MKQPAIPVLAAALSACTVGESMLTYDEFAAQAEHEPETDMRYVDGDTPVASDEEMRELYDAYVASFDAAPVEAAAALATGLIVNEKGGRVDKWSPGEARDLRYCISRDKFGALYGAMIDAMNVAAGDWEAAANVNFIHVAAKDGDCTQHTGGVVFDVRLVCEPRDFFARAFFPSSAPRKKRELVMHCDAFDLGLTAPETIYGITRHELGHILGFRHEHIRPQAGRCREGGRWRPLTGYDAKSVMHYPECNGKQKGDTVLTDKDRRGARSLYPF